MWIKCLILAVFLSCLSGCFQVHNEARLIKSDGGDIESTKICNTQIIDRSTLKSLAASGFTLTSWNIYKQKGTGWRDDLNRLSAQSDLLLLQEAWLKPGLTAQLSAEQLHWDMTPGFTYQGTPTGVLTAGKSPASLNCSLIYREPNIYLPKAVLMSYYPIEGYDDSLLVVNIHSVNFTLGIEAPREQLLAAKKIMDRHKGPLILAGDFNTWSDARMAMLQAITNDAGLIAVFFDGQQPAEHLGRVVDHIYYKGLERLRSEVTQVESSDHYPLSVSFAAIGHK